MQFIMLILSMMILVGCGQKDYSPISHDNEITHYTAEFSNMARHKGVPDKVNKISFSFKNMANNILGTCTIMYKNHWTGTQYEEYEYGRKIEINPVLWGPLSDNQRYQLLTHELGHCSLNRGHRNAYLVNVDDSDEVYQISVMNMYQLDESDYVTFRPYYLEELFNQSVDPRYAMTSLLQAPLDQYAMFASSTDTSAASLARNDESLPIFIDPELDHEDCVKTEHLPAE